MEIFSFLPMFLHYSMVSFHSHFLSSLELRSSLVVALEVSLLICFSHPPNMYMKLLSSSLLSFLNAIHSFFYIYIFELYNSGIFVIHTLLTIRFIFKYHIKKMIWN